MSYHTSTIAHTAPITEAIRLIDENKKKIALVVDESKKFIGTVTDGDIRRAILRNCALTEPVETIANKNALYAEAKHSPAERKKMAAARGICYLPILDESHRVIELETLERSRATKPQDVPVVIMAGGLAKRLRPITENCPKPLLNVGGRPILETIICTLRDHGFKDFYLSVNYKAEMIVNYFSDGSLLGVNIHYLREDEPRGTAGALKLLPKLDASPVLVMNGDVLTNVDFSGLLHDHHGEQSDVTVCVKEYDFQVPYGVIRLDQNQITEIEEKPVHAFFINAGIYMINSSLFEHIPSDTYFDMTDFLGSVMQQKAKCHAFPIREYWLDIGQKDDFEKASKDYATLFKEGS